MRLTYLKISEELIYEASDNPQKLSLLLNKIDALPESLKDVLTNPDVAIFLQENIVDKYSLLSEEANKLYLLIGAIIFGDIYLGDMVKFIAEKLDLDLAAGRIIANEIFSFLFSRESLEELKNLHLSKFGQVRMDASSNNQEPPAKQNESSNIVDLRNN